MPDGPLACFFWRSADAVDYWIIQLRLWILDAICGPEPPTAVDQERGGIATVCGRLSRMSRSNIRHLQFLRPATRHEP
jgi:hypothetical protein